MPESLERQIAAGQGWSGFDGLVSMLLLIMGAVMIGGLEHPGFSQGSR